MTLDQLLLEDPGEPDDLSKTARIVFDESRSRVNTADDVLTANVKHNIRLGLPQVRPFQQNPEVVLLVCGGPSLEETQGELRQAYFEGGKIVAVNGAYRWCIERNLKPSVAIMLDAREFNARFFEEPVPGCRYLLASQCHPKAFEICKDRDTWIWHGCCSPGEADALKEYYFDKFWVVDVGITVGIRSISLMRMLGFHSFDIFGLDSCVLGGAHHAYSQVENDLEVRKKVWLRPRNRDDKAECFICTPWHVKQAHTFIELIRKRGDMFRLNVRGRGLLASILRIGAELHLEEEG